MTSCKKWLKSICQYESNPHYLELLCLKETTFGPKPNTNSHHVKNIEILKDRQSLKKLCVLPKGHHGKCMINMNRIFKSYNHNEPDYHFIEKLKQTINTKIYSTPGNDDYVYKNRADRLFDTVLPDSSEKLIRDKDIKKKCAISLRDCSTPILVAQSYLDWLTITLSIRNIHKYLNTESNDFNSIMKYIQLHKKFLENEFKKHNKQIFRNGNTICAVTGNYVNLEDIVDLNRDSRINPKDSDIQLGHVAPRSEDEVSIRGLNILPMNRLGNRILGDNNFTQDEWIDYLQQIIHYQRPSKQAEEINKLKNSLRKSKIQISRLNKIILDQNETIINCAISTNC
jgi:hypothetical protein